MAAGIDTIKKTIEYVLVDRLTVTEKVDRLTVTEKVDEYGVIHIRLLSMDNRLVAVCCRSEQYIDILQVTGNRLSVSNKNTAVDVCGDKWILSIGQHVSNNNTVMLGGIYWMKRLNLKTE